MEEIFDTGRYMRGLRRRWWLVAGLAVIGILAGLVISLVLPKVYAASAQILVTTPKLKLQFDTRLISTTDAGLTRDFHRTLIALGTTRAVEERVLAALGDAAPASLREPGKLAEAIELSQVDGTSSVYELTASSTRPAFAQQLAATWAREYAAAVNDYFGLSPQSQTDIAQELDRAVRELGQAEAALADFRSTTGIGLVDNIQYPGTLARSTGLTERQNLFGLYERYGAQGTDLQAKNTTLGLYQAALDDLELVLAAAAALPAAAPASDLPLELLSQSPILAPTAEDGAAAGGGINLAELAGKTAAEARAVLEAEQLRLQETIAQLKPQLDALNAALSRQSEELTRLVRAVALAEEKYIILALKQTETQTQETVTDSWMVVIQEPVEPKTPVSPVLPLNLLLGAACGLLAGILAALLLAWLGR